jgi:hypothetical protein
MVDVPGRTSGGSGQCKSIQSKFSAASYRPQGGRVAISCRGGASKAMMVHTERTDEGSTVAPAHGLVLKDS